MNSTNISHDCPERARLTAYEQDYHHGCNQTLFEAPFVAHHTHPPTHTDDRFNSVPFTVMTASKLDYPLQQTIEVVASHQ